MGGLKTHFCEATIFINQKMFLKHFRTDLTNASSIDAIFLVLKYKVSLLNFQYFLQNPQKQPCQIIKSWQLETKTQYSTLLSSRSTVKLYTRHYFKLIITLQIRSAWVKKRSHSTQTRSTTDFNSLWASSFRLSTTSISF